MLSWWNPGWDMLLTFFDTVTCSRLCFASICSRLLFGIEGAGFFNVALTLAQRGWLAVLLSCVWLCGWCLGV